MYKLIAIDLDGTLLNTYGEVSNENKIAIKKAIDAGIQVILCSGRITNSVKNIAREIEADNYLISGNGAVLYDMRKEKILYNNCINKELIMKIIQICEENSIYYSVYTENSILASSLQYNVLCYNNENARKKSREKNKNKHCFEYLRIYKKILITRLFQNNNM